MYLPIRAVINNFKDRIPINFGSANIFVFIKNRHVISKKINYKLEPRLVVSSGCFSFIWSLWNCLCSELLIFHYWCSFYKFTNLIKTKTIYSQWFDWKGFTESLKRFILIRKWSFMNESFQVICSQQIEEHRFLILLKTPILKQIHVQLSSRTWFYFENDLVWSTHSSFPKPFDSSVEIKVDGRFWHSIFQTKSFPYKDYLDLLTHILVISSVIFWFVKLDLIVNHFQREQLYTKVAKPLKNS